MIADSVALPEGARTRGRRRRRALLRRLRGEPRLRARRRCGRRPRRAPTGSSSATRTAARCPDEVAAAVARRARASSSRGRHPHPQRRRARGREHARRGRRRRDAGAGDDQRLRRARRQREPLLGHPEPRAQARRARATPPSSSTADRALARSSTRSRTCRPNPRLPYVGDARVRAQGRDPRPRGRRSTRRTYEHVDPASGRQRAAHPDQRAERAQQRDRDGRARSGSSSIGDGPLAPCVARKMKELEQRGLPLRGRRGVVRAARPSRERRATCGRSSPSPTPSSSRTRDDGSGTSSHASAEVRRRAARSCEGEGAGGGPLDALERAVRERARCRPTRRSRVVLTSDFRAQVRAGTGPRARHRPRPLHARTVEGRPTWTTVGSSPDLMHAAWLALADASSTRSRRAPASTRAST